MSKKTLSGVVVLFLFSLNPVIAGPLTSAEITKIINHVAVIDPAAGERPALIRDVIKDDLGVQTAERSRSELLFQDNTLTRLGAETFFSFRTGTRDMTLERGSMLLQVPKGLGGATIHTAAVTAAITGTTIMMEYVPGALHQGSRPGRKLALIAQRNLWRFAGASTGQDGDHAAGRQTDPRSGGCGPETGREDFDSGELSGLGAVA